jgi:hypothetical protein
MTNDAILSNMHVVSYFLSADNSSAINVDIASNLQPLILDFFIGSILSKSWPHNHIILYHDIFAHLYLCKISSQLRILQYDGFTFD